MASVSAVWTEFTRVNDKEAKCKTCKKLIKCVGGSTSGLARHLATHRPSTVTSSGAGESSETGPSNKQTKLMSFFAAKKPLKEILAELTAVDGFSFNAIAKSAYLRHALENDGHKLPKNPYEISQLVQEYAAEKQSNLVNAFKMMVQNAGARFSLTMDEYTSLQNKRFMNINLHTEDEHWNLGVFRIEGSMTSERVVELLQEKLGI